MAQAGVHPPVDAGRHGHGGNRAMRQALDLVAVVGLVLGTVLERAAADVEVGQHAPVIDGFADPVLLPLAGIERSRHLPDVAHQDRVLTGVVEVGLPVVNVVGHRRARVGELLHDALAAHGLAAETENTTGHVETTGQVRRRGLRHGVERLGGRHVGEAEAGRGAVLRDLPVEGHVPCHPVTARALGEGVQFRREGTNGIDVALDEGPHLGTEVAGEVWNPQLYRAIVNRPRQEQRHRRGVLGVASAADDGQVEFGSGLPVHKHKAHSSPHSSGPRPVRST